LLLLHDNSKKLKNDFIEIFDLFLIIDNEDSQRREILVAQGYQAIPEGLSVHPFG